MAVLSDYKAFDGRHWETGTVVNLLAYRGMKNPFTGRPYTEAFLMGVSGGAVMGYFSFDYEGYDPHCRILTRNTFDPFDTMLSRLGVVQEIYQTTNPVKAERNLLNLLEMGTPALVWADMWSLPYNCLEFDEGMWGNFPILVYGYDTEGDLVHIADRARVPLTCPVEDFRKARGRVKKDKFRVIDLAPPQEEKIKSAIHLGICDTIKLYTEKPPKGSKDSFGLRAFDWWIKNLTNPRARISWEKIFPAGRRMVAGLINAYGDIMHFGKDGGAERDLYADFLEEAGDILETPGYKEVADVFRRSTEEWNQLAITLLPDDVPYFSRLRSLHDERHGLFLDKGNGGGEQIRAINAEIQSLLKAAETDFPLTQNEVITHRERIAEQVAVVRDIESEAVRLLGETVENK